MKTETAAPASPANPHADLSALDALAGEAAAAAVAADPNAPVGPPAAPSIPTEKLCEMLLAPCFMIFAPNWKVSEQEVQTLAGAYGAVLDKYFPDGLGDWAPEISAVLVTAMVITPRMGKPAKVEEKKPAPSADASA